MFNIKIYQAYEQIVDMWLRWEGWHSLNSKSLYGFALNDNLKLASGNLHVRYMSNYLDLIEDSDCLYNCISLRIDETLGETTFFSVILRKQSCFLYLTK